MSIVYVLISLITIIMFLVMKKTNKKENIILWMALSTIILMCFNIFITLIFSMVKLKSTLFNLSLTQIALILLFGIQIFRKKQIQKYYINKKDLVVSIILLIIVIVIGIAQYGFPFDIKYIITDGAVHYFSTINFYNESDLLSNVKYNYIVSFSTFMTGAYVNCGILLKSLSDFILIKDFYMVFVLFDLMIFFLSGQLFYLLITKKLHKKSEYVLAFIFTLIYMLGYPLNSLLSGFCYLSLGLDIILAIMLMMNYMKNDNNEIILLSISLLTLGLFFSYYFFAPVIYFSILVFLIRKYISKKEKIFKIKNMIEIIYILIIPTLLGMYYMFFKEIFTQDYNLPNKVLTIEGTIYSNLITNFIVFVPLVICYLITNFVNKKKNFNTNILILEIIFIIFLGVGKIFGKVSDYYFYKSYYLLWIIVLVVSFCEIILLKRNKKIKNIIIYYTFIIYAIGIILFPVIFKDSGIIYDIYNYNFENIKQECIIESEYLELVQYYYENLENEKFDVYMIAGKTEGRNRWIYSLYQNPIYLISSEKNNFEDWLNYGKEKYFIYYKGDLKYEPEQNDERYEIIFNNSSGAILKK